MAAPERSTDQRATEQHTVTLAVPEAGHIDGDLVAPDHPRGIILFAHGSGSSRHSPRNRRVAAVLRAHGFATFLMDLLTEAEERQDAGTAQFRFDIQLLARRLELASTWVAEEPSTARLPLGYFGASTGAAAALVAAAQGAHRADAIVSRGGRPDLAGTALTEVRAATLLIVGGHDQQVLELNEAAAVQLPGPHEIQVVPGATHLFEEPGTLDEVARLAAEWFSAHLHVPKRSP